MEYSLRNPVPGIVKDGRTTFGGSQKLLKNKTLQHCGCGVVAALDLVRYLHLYRAGFDTDFFAGVEDNQYLPMAVYDLCAHRMQSYIPAIYPIGTDGFSLTLGLNRYFQRYGLPMQARWGVRQKQLWDEIEVMLAEDLPVILSIGNRFPQIWKKEGLTLYRRQRDGTFRKATQAKGHYVLVVGIDDNCLRISSWGTEYYLKRDEFLRYCTDDSIPLLCSIVRLSPR